MYATTPRLETVEAAMDLEKRHQLAQSERGFGLIAAIIYLAPALGLIGTVIGFNEITIALTHLTSYGVGEGIQKALITTVAGLLVAAPLTGGLFFLRAWHRRLAGNCSYAAAELLIALSKMERNFVN